MCQNVLKKREWKIYSFSPTFPLSLFSHQKYIHPMLYTRPLFLLSFFFRDNHLDTQRNDATNAPTMEIAELNNCRNVAVETVSDIPSTSLLSSALQNNSDEKILQTLMVTNRLKRTKERKNE
jgi:hypothetical protein